MKVTIAKKYLSFYPINQPKFDSIYSFNGRYEFV